MPVGSVQGLYKMIGIFFSVYILQCHLCVLLLIHGRISMDESRSQDSRVVAKGENLFVFIQRKKKKSPLGFSLIGWAEVLFDWMG